MKSDDFSPALIAFIRDHVRSVELLEVLLLLRRDPARRWDSPAVAGELRIQPRSAESRLTGLHQLGLLLLEPPQYAFDPASPLVDIVAELAEVYQSHRVSVIELIFAQRPADNAQAFADAFVIGKKGKNDG